MSLRDVLCQLNQAKRSTFHLATNNFEFDLGRVRNFSLDVLVIKSEGTPRIAWHEWAMPFIIERNFVMGWIANVEYDFWQNAEDPLEYVAKGRTHEDLPKKSNGLPYPLEKTIVDTSHNPGRWQLRNGYCEAIGAVMWLGDDFWQLANADKKTIKNVDWIHISNPTDSVTKLKVLTECFSTDAGVEGERQDKFRSLLFGKDKTSK